MPRKKRILEELPLAAPLPPREPTAGELEAQAQSDARIREYLKFRLGPVIAELRKRNKKFCKPIGDGEEIQIISPVNPEHLPNGMQVEGQNGGDVPMQEPQSAVNASNGEVQAEQGNNAIPANIAETATGDAMDMMADGAASAQPDPSQPMLATTSAETGPEGQMQEQAQLAIPMAPNPIRNEMVLTFRFHDISLDKVHERLFADRYHTPEMMLADIQRIVENAYHEGDPDTLSKADQMLNYARIMCDQACDPAFRVDCQRMAQREKDRAKKRAQARLKAREDAAAEANKREQAAIAQTEETEDSNNKRPREDGEEDNGNDQAKRARFTEDVVMAESPTRVGHPSSQSLMPATPAAPTASTSSNGAANETAIAPIAITAPPREPTPPPAEPLPDFILPEVSLSDLGRFLVTHTGALTVDELEQLRAACYDCIWRARKSWDKTGVIDEIRELAEEFISELEESKRSDREN